MVLFGHTRGLYFEGIGKVEEAGFGTRAFYLLTSMQHEGVVLFFVVSGYLVGGSIWQKMSQSRFRGLDYLVNRFARIYLVFVPGVALVAIAYLFGDTLLGETRFYSERPLVPSGIIDGGAFPDVVCHLACLQGLFCSAWGRNPPLWSLGYEWVLYLAAPVLFAILFSPVATLWRVVAIVLLLATLATLLHGSRDWLFWFSVWLTGSVAHRLHGSRNVTPGWGLAGLGLVVAACLLSRAKLVPEMAADCAIAAGLATALACRRIASSCPAPGMFRALAGFSFSLYVLHLPLGLLSGGLLERIGLVGHSLAQPAPSTYAAFVLTVFAVLGVTWGFARQTEARTNEFRRFLLASAGRPRFLARDPEAAVRRATNIQWQTLEVSRQSRAGLLGQVSTCLWFTGFSGAGKSTIASLLEKRLHAMGYHTFTLDGDNVRHSLCRDLGFGDDDRIENIRRVAEVAKLFSDAGLVVIVSLISPFRAERQMARELFECAEFIEVFVDTPLDVCEARDPKGLYKEARAGRLRNFTGIDSAYEPPSEPEVHLRAGDEAPETLVEHVLSELQRRGRI